MTTWPAHSGQVSERVAGGDVLVQVVPGTRNRHVPGGTRDWPGAGAVGVAGGGGRRDQNERAGGRVGYRSERTNDTHSARVTANTGQAGSFESRTITASGRSAPGW